MRNTAIRRRTLLAAGALVAAPAIIRAQGYPTKPIKIVVGFAPGGTTDIVARLLAPYLSDSLGQPVVIENKSGASGNIGTDLVAGTTPDGYTFLVSASGQIVVNPGTLPVLRAHPVKDLQHVCGVAQCDVVLAVNPAVQARNVGELVALSKRERMTYGTSANGGLTHVLFELFKMRAGLDIPAVHYRGTAPMMPDWMGNQFQLGLDTVTTLMPYIKTDKLRGLFIISKVRSPLLPNVPTAAEAGLKDFDDYKNWFGLHAPKGTPEPIVSRVRQAVMKAAQDAGYKEKLSAQGLSAMTETADEFNRRIQSELQAYAEVIKKANIRIE
ncbi:MAG: Bug family tripartite tricarboxylate transporter substrate binding protein [Ramlibacter sp.]